MRPRSIALAETAPVRVVTHAVPGNPAKVLESILSDLVARVEGARDAALADRNGLPIATASVQQIGLDLASAMSALIVHAALRVLEEFGPDRLQVAVLEGSRVRILVCEVSEGVGSLILVTDTDANLALAKMELLRAAMQITTIIDLDVL